MDNNDSRKWLYESLKGKGYDLGSYDEFDSHADEAETRKWLYETARESGFDMGSYEDFDKGIGYRAPRQEETISVNPQTIADTFSETESEYPSLKEMATVSRFAPIDFSQNTEVNAMSPYSVESLGSRLQQLKKDGKLDMIIHQKEERELDRIYSPKKVEKETDALENYRGRFGLTERGKFLNEELDSIRKEITDRYTNEYLASDRYKQLSSRYSGKQLNEEIDKDFQQQYGDRILKDMAPYMDAYNQQVFNRYGVGIQDDLTTLAKGRTKNQVADLRRDIEQELEKTQPEVIAPAGSAFIPSPAYGAAQRYGNVQSKEQQDRYTSLVAAKNLLDEADDIVNEASKKGDTTFLGGFGRGARDKGFDVDTWAMGITDTAYGSLLKKAAQKSDRGEELSSEEKKLLEAAAVNMATQAYFSSDLGRGYKAGSTSAQSIPFMLEFALNPVSGSGNAIAKGILKYGAKRFGLKALESSAVKNGLKIGSRLAGDAVAAAGMTATSGLGHVASGAQERMMGDVQFDFDNSGKIEYAGHQNQMSAGDAWLRSTLSNVLENQSEMVFNAFKGAGSVVGLPNTGKLFPGIERFSASKAGELYRAIKNNPTYRKLAARTQFHGMPEEYFEEVYNNLVSLPLGEGSWEESTDIDNNIDTFLGVAPTCIVMSMLGLGSVAKESYSTRRNRERFEKTLSQDELSFFKDLKQRIKDGNIEDAREFVKLTLNDKKLTPAEKKEKIRYVYDMLQENTIEAVQNAEIEDVIQKETDDIVNSSNQADGTVTECNRITTNEIGETVLVPGHIVGWMGGTVIENPDGTKSREGGQPIWQPVGSKERITLHEGEYDPESIKSMPTKVMMEATAEMMREEAQKKAEMESKYDLNRIDPPHADMDFIDKDGNKYHIVDKNPNGGWIAEAFSVDEKGNPTSQMVEITHEEYYDTIQAQLDAQEKETALQQKYGTKVLDDGRTAVITSEKNGEISYDVIGFRGNLEDSGNMSLQEYESLRDYVPVQEEELDDDGFPVNSRQEENSSNLSENQAENEILSPAGENIVTPNEASDAIAEANPATEPMQEQKPALPVDEKGNILYHKMPVENTIADLTDGTLDDNEIDDFIAANKVEAGKLLKKVSESAPKISTNKAKYLADKKVWQEKVADAQARVNYWNSIGEEMAASRVQPGDKTAEAILSMGEPLNGEELAAMMLGTGRLPILYDSYKKETGGRNAEARGMVGLFATKANGGLSIEEAGEQLMLADQENGTHFFDENDPNAGRNAIIDVLSGARTRGDLFGFIQRNREALAERERQAELEAYEQTIARLAEASHMTPEEFIAFEENIAQMLEERLKDIPDEELKSIFAELYLDENYGRSRESDEVGTGVPEGEERAGSNERSSGVLGEERSDNAGASEYSQERPELDDEIGQSGDGVLPAADAVDGREKVAPVGSYDRQGNPIDGHGNLIIERIDSIEQLTDEDFNTPSRSVQLPLIPTNVSEAIGAGSKPVIIKKNIFEKNRNTHKELTPEKSRNILVGALYSPNLIGQVQPIKRPNYWVAIDTADKNSVVVLEVNNKKDNVEIVGWRLVDTKGLEKMKRQAEREGGQFLIQTSTNDAAAALSTLPSGLSSESKDSKLSNNKQENAGFVSPLWTEGEPILDYAARVVESKRVHDAGSEVDTHPTEAQKEAGNYKKGHLKIDGFDITIENPKGSVRNGVDADGKPWSVTMNNTYGYIRGTEGVDGDHIDVFLGDSGNKVYVVDQVKPDGSFDEHKVMYGFNSMEEATEAYLSNYSPGWQGLGAISEVSKETFKKWIDSSHRKTKPFVDYKSVKVENGGETVENLPESNPIASSKKSELGIEIPAMTEEEYIASEGYSFLGIGDVALHKGKQRTSKQQDKIVESQAQKDEVYAKHREILRKKYRDKLNKGELREPNTIEKLLKTANGNPDNESTQAARRSLQKRGIDWQENSVRFRVVHHGSGASFDKFSTEFIDTGEGNQSFGWGLYFTDKKDIAQYYAETIGGMPSYVLYKNGQRANMDEQISRIIYNFDGSVKKAIASNKKTLKYLEKEGDEEFASESRKIISELEKEDPKAWKLKEEGNRYLYDVEIPDTGFLHWDKAVADEQKGQIIQQANKEGLSFSFYGDIVTPEEYFQKNQPEGFQVYKMLSKILGGDKEASMFLNRSGFNGIEYAAGRHSGNSKLSDSNFVVFDENAIRIINHLRYRLDGREIDEEKALNYLHLSAPIAEASNSSELSSATKIVETFESPTMEQGKIVSAVENLADSLHTPVRAVKSVEELPEGDVARKRIENGDRIKGWFDIKSEEMAIYLPNATSVEDARESVFHEVVGHYGLRKLFGEDFNTFLDNVYANVSPEIRKQIVARAKERGNILDLREATEEYLAALAEQGFDNVEERTLWQKIKDAFIDMLRKAGVHLGFDLTDNELRYVLWKSYQNLESQSIMERAADIDMQRRLRVGNFREDEAELHYSELKKEADRLKELTGRDVNLGRNEEEIAFMMSSDGADARTIDHVRDTFARAREEGKKFFGFFDADTGKVYLCADQIKDINQLRGKWIHEISHQITSQFSDEELAKLYDKVGVDEIEDFIGDFYRDLPKERKVDEYLSIAVEEIVTDTESFDELMKGKGVDEVLEHWEYPKIMTPYISTYLKNTFYGKEKNEKILGNDRRGEKREDELRLSGDVRTSSKERIEGKTERRFRTGESTGEEENTVRAYEKEIRELNNRISSLERAIERYENGENVSKAVVDEIRRQISSDFVNEINKSELNSLLAQVQKAKTKKSLEKIFMNVKRVALDAHSRKLQRVIDKLLALKVQDVNGKNMSIAKNVDDSTRKIFAFIRGNLSDLKISGLEDEILFLKRENRKRQEEVKRLERVARDSSDVQERESSRTSIEELKKAIEESKKSIKELRDEANEIKESVANFKDVDIEKELGLLNDKIERAARNEDTWTQNDNERMAALNIISATITNKKHDYEIRDIELRIQKMVLNNSDLYRERGGLKDEVKRKRINEKIKENHRQIGAMERLINDTRSMQVQQMQMTIDQLNELISNGKNSLLRKTEDEMKRKRMLIGNVIRSVEGKPVNIKTKDLDKERTLKKFFSAPMGSFEYMCQRVNTKTLGKDGFLYKRFIEGSEGTMRAYDTYILGMKEVKSRLNEKTRELFGKSFEKITSLSDKVVNESGVHVFDPTSGDGYGVRYEEPMSKGQAMYIYQVWKMADGRTKLELQGFDEESIAEIVDFIGPEYVKFADWVQEEFLPELRERYNERYLEMYNTSLAKIENYIPLKINKNAIREESSLSDDGKKRKTLEEKAGSLINRVVNTHPVDMVNGFNVLLEHTNQMEEWNAYARVRRDLDYILSSTIFRNQLNANVRGSYKNFYDAAEVATMVHHPESSGHMDEVLGKISKGIVGGNISFRLYTAIKQTLSAPAFLGYSQSPFFMAYLAKNASTPYQGFKWCMKNIPSFYERVTSGTTGNEKLNEKSFKKWMDKYIEYGMIPNKLVDALTCSFGAKSIYDYKYSQLKKSGLSEKESHNQALAEADIYYNATQQSSHPAFLSPMQMSRTFTDRMFTTYQNSNIGYVRKVMASYYDLTRSLKWKELKKNYTEMYMQEGLSGEEAESKAYRRLLNENKKHVVELALFGWGLNMLWNIGSQGLLGFLRGDGDNDDKWTKGLAFMLTSPMKGLPGGNLLESIASGYGMNPFLVFEELKKFMEEAKYAIDEYGLISPEIAYITLSKASRYTGVDLEVWGNVYLGVEGMARDGALADDRMIDVMYLLNAPKSNRATVAKELYRDEPLLDFAEKVARANKYIPKGDAWEGWVPGTKDLTKRRKNEIAKEYERLHMTEEQKKEADEREIADNHKQKLKELEDDILSLAEYIDNHKEEHNIYKKYY